MKRLLIIIIFSSFSFILKGQINDEIPGDTIHLKAGWNMGQKLYFEFNKKELSVSGKDTIPHSHYYEKFMIEVTDSTENGYVLTYTLLENSNKIIMIDGSTIQLLSGYLPHNAEVSIQMDKYGAVTDILSWDLKGGDTGIFELVIDENGWGNPDNATPISDNKTKESIAEDIAHVLILYKFHGHTFKTGLVYEWSESRSNAWTDDLIMGGGEVWVEYLDDSKEKVIIGNHLILDSERLTESYIKYFSTLVEDPSLLNSLEKRYIHIDEDLFIINDLKTGCVQGYNLVHKSAIGKDSQIETVEVKIIPNP